MNAQQRRREAAAARQAENSRLIGAIVFGALSLLVFYVATSGDGTELLQVTDLMTSVLLPLGSPSAAASDNDPKVIVVVGGGLAGLTASIELGQQIRELQEQHEQRRLAKIAADPELARLRLLSGDRNGNDDDDNRVLNITVLVIEKEGQLGGNSAKASSGMNAVQTRVQRSRAVVDSVDLFTNDTLHSGQGLSDPLLVDTLARGAQHALDFLEGRTGLQFELLTQLGGHGVPRTHRPGPTPNGRPVNVGFETIRALTTLIRADYGDLIRIRLGSRVTRLIVSPDDVVAAAKEREEKEGEEKKKKKIVGVELANGERVSAAAVILTTGGYAADRDGYLQEHVPDVATLPTTNGQWATGDGMRLAHAIGAQLKHMDQVQIHPTAFVDPSNTANPSKFLAPEALRGSGGVLLNEQGRRFVNELGLRDHVSTLIRQQTNASAYLVLNPEAVALYSAPALAFYRSKGFVVDYGNASAFAIAVLPAVNPKVVEETLASYGASAADPFGKTVFPTRFRIDEQLTVMRITPALHYTMGGIAIDPRTAKVLFVQNERTVDGIFAAGEATGGLHGANRLAGNSLLECVVFGRQAAASALDHLLSKIEINPCE